MVRSIFAIIAAVLITGCSIAGTAPPRDRDSVLASIEVVGTLPSWCQKEAYACVKHNNNGIGAIYIRSDMYPMCITHEIIHLFTDNWHDGVDSTELCHPD